MFSHFIGEEEEVAARQRGGLEIGGGLGLLRKNVYAIELSSFRPCNSLVLGCLCALECFCIAIASSRIKN